MLRKCCCVIGVNYLVTEYRQKGSYRYRMYWVLATIYPVDGSNGNSQENLENSQCQSLRLILVNL